MGDFKAGSTNAVVLAGMCTALAVVLSMIGLYMPLFSTIVFLLIPLPIAYLGMREGDPVVGHRHERDPDPGLGFLRHRFCRFPLRDFRDPGHRDGDLLQA